MLTSPNNSTDFRLLLPEVIWLEPEYFDQAKNISSQSSDESSQWQNYLNTLALIALEEWLKERIPEKSISKQSQLIENTCSLNVGDFKFCIIATENLLHELVYLPKNIVEDPELATHFYVVLEVLEEQEEVIVRGCLRYDQLVNYQNQVSLQPQDNYYKLPLSLFDTEPNHLLFYCRFLEPTSIPLPVAEMTTAAKPLEYMQKSTIKLSQWLQDIFDETWQTVDSLINPEANLVYSIRNVDEGAKRAKLLDLGMQLGNQNVALLVKIKEEPEEKLAILIQLHPGGGARCLPPNLKLILLSKAGKILQEVQSRNQDNYIQLKPFKGEQGKRFKIQVSLGSVSITENFEL
ncbi:DUF1822 family protein [Nostoc sp. UHCC 0251]|uniref:DUF1822 family protein n=1 Tax=Nostoc sp. UHCC 0251 TaxID=3110240 RepID=UPI002B20A3BD|nr:DUF1822 family protein [Nostoc sp. UHCC 0251]MEA5626522.1 DUF1822 family protein [Nostoc sp. UHCC 0251]